MNQFLLSFIAVRYSSACNGKRVDGRSITEMTDLYCTVVLILRESSILARFRLQKHAQRSLEGLESSS